MELARRLNALLKELKPPMGDILSDFFVEGLRYEEIAKKRAIPIGGVGVYLKRGLEKMRRLWRQEQYS